MSGSRQRHAALEPAAIKLIEEAVHLLRCAPHGTLLVYYAGTVPWVLGLLFFWAHLTWFTPSGTVVAWAALGLVVLFTGMKAAHAEFCGRLLAQRLSAPPATLTGARFRRLVMAQLPLQAWGLFVLPLALMLAVPFGWGFAYFQSAAVMGDGEDAAGHARTQAMLWPAQNHLALLTFSLLALGAWANLAAFFWMVPWLAERLLGIENIFGLSRGWFFNTTFLASVTALTWLAVDPLLKAFYTLRVFHGRALRSGEDIRVELGVARRSRAGLRAALVLAWVAMIVGTGLPARAADPVPTRATRTAELDRAITATLDDGDFRWRLRPEPRLDDSSKENGIGRFSREGAGMVRDTAKKIWRAIVAFVDWLVSALSSDRKSAGKSSGGMSATAPGVMLLIFMAVAVAAIVVAFLIMWRRTHTPAPVLRARAAGAATPDLHDEATQAAQLPTDGWLALAREQMARGDWRLALRALLLATLAQLAADGLIALAKFKTNLDYEREVRRRAIAREDVANRFGVRRRAFEAAWYGRAQPGESEVRDWLTELEQPAKR